MNIPKIYVSEIFNSIQGEGILTGYQTLFVRLQGCRIGCVWCDTKYTWKKSDKHTHSAYDLYEEIKNSVKPESWICITGGEPLEQITSVLWLAEKLQHNDFTKLSIETAGVIDIGRTGNIILPDNKEILDLVATGMFFSISPKLKSALKERFNIIKLLELMNVWDMLIDAPFRAQYKFVVSTTEDLDIVKHIALNSKTKHYIIIQLEESKIKDVSFIAECCKFIKLFPQIGIAHV